MDLLTVIQFF